MNPATCANCQATLSGPYCSQCGQHAHESARSISTLTHEAWHVVTHVDGRLWRSLGNLLLRPGFLTQEYFAERRARYLPPVRLYLVLSVLVFALGSFAGREEGAGVVPATPAGKADTAKVDPAVAARVREALDRAGAKAHPAADAGAAGVPAVAPHAKAAPSATPAGAADTGDDDAADRDDDARGAAPGAAPAATTARPGGKVRHMTGLEFLSDADCDSLTSAWPWLTRAMRAACHRNITDRGRLLFHTFYANLPKMMFVFLPLMAATMLLLYWFPRRYYVEHLVLFLHTHAALYLLTIVVVMLGWLGAAVPGLHWLGDVAVFAGLLYAAWYVYKAMRRYYGQGRMLTLLKYCLVGTVYLVLLALTAVAALVYTAVAT